MALTPETVADLAAEYRDEEALAAVEADHVEMLPGMFADADFGWRDAVWVVRWYYRRFLGAVPNAERRAGEDAFDENTYGEVRAVINDVTESQDLVFQLERLTSLEGVDLPVATAFLQFVDPDTYLVIGEREWTTLATHGPLEGPYPTPPTAADYRAYLDAAHTVADRCDCVLWTLYQAIWRLARQDHDGDTVDH